MRVKLFVLSSKTKSVIMEKEFFFDRQKVVVQILFGIVCFIGMIFIPIGFIRILLFFLGGSFIYFGSKGVSAKPQIIIDKESLFIGLKINKSFKWGNIYLAKIKNVKVDYRKVDYLELTVLVSSKGTSYKRIIEAPVHLLNINPAELAKLINDQIIESK